MSKLQQIPFDLSVRPAHGRDDFLIAPSNIDAVGWLDRWPNWPAPMLILSGPAACGKTHLAAVWKEMSGACEIDPTLLSEMEAGQIAAKGEHLLIDGIDLAIGLREAETCLFHLYNMFKEDQRSLLVTTRLNISAVGFEVADLASRMRAAPVAMIHAPDDDLLSSVLVKLFSDRQLQVSVDVVKYILPRIERSFSAVRSLVTEIDRQALAQKRPVSIPLVRDVMMRFD